MTVDFVRARLAEAGATIPGLAYAYPRIPLAIVNAHLPAQIVRVGEARYDRATLGEEILNEGRIYRLKYYVAELETGAEGQAEEAATVFLDPVRNFWIARPQLQFLTSSEAVYRAELESDSGAVIGIEFPVGSGKRYAGFEFLYRIFEVHPIAYIG